jgi:hypothetical protein
MRDECVRRRPGGECTQVWRTNSLLQNPGNPYTTGPLQLTFKRSRNPRKP